jgi:hypothetical protein
VKQFFSNMSLARWILVSSLVFSAVLAFTGTRLHRERTALEDSLQVQVPKLAQEIQINSRRYTRLWEQAEGAGLTGGQQDAQTYLRGLAIDRDVVLGGIDIVPQATFQPMKGVIDVKYLIRPQARDRGFVRVNLANYMHLIEQRSRRMRVTHVRLDREGKGLKPWEYGNDRWTWELEVTSRQKQGAE